MSKKPVINITKLLFPASGYRRNNQKDAGCSLSLLRNKLVGLYNDQQQAWCGELLEWGYTSSGIYKGIHGLFSRIDEEQRYSDSDCPRVGLCGNNGEGITLQLDLPSWPVSFAVDGLSSNSFDKDAVLAELFASLRLSSLEGLKRCLDADKSLLSHDLRKRLRQKCEQCLRSGCDTLLSAAILEGQTKGHKNTLEKAFEDHNTRLARQVELRDPFKDFKPDQPRTIGISGEDIKTFVITVPRVLDYTFIQFEQDLRKSLFLQPDTEIAFNGGSWMMDVFEEEEFSALIQRLLCSYGVPLDLTLTNVKQHTCCDVVRPGPSAPLAPLASVLPPSEEAAFPLGIWASLAGAAYLGTGISAGVAFCFYPPIRAMVLPIFKSIAITDPMVFGTLLLLGALLLVLAGMITVACVKEGAKVPKGQVKSKIFNRELDEQMKRDCSDNPNP